MRDAHGMVGVYFGASRPHALVLANGSSLRQRRTALNRGAARLAAKTAAVSRRH